MKIIHWIITKGITDNTTLKKLVKREASFEFNELQAFLKKIAEHPNFKDEVKKFIIGDKNEN